MAKALGAGSILLTISVATAAMELAASLGIFSCAPLRLRDVSATFVSSEARRCCSAPMFAVVDVLISSASYVGSSGGPPAFLFFARGASTAGVSSSSDVFSIHRLPVLNAELLLESDRLSRTSGADVCRLSSQVRFAAFFHDFIRFFLSSPPSVLSVFPIGCAKWPLIPALVTAAKFRRESASRMSIWPRRLVPLVAHAAALLSRVTIWSPHSHKLTRDFISLVTFFPDRIVLVLIPTFFIGTSTLLGLTSLFKFCRRFRSHSQLRSNSVFTMQTISVASINRKLGSVT